MGENVLFLSAEGVIISFQNVQEEKQFPEPRDHGLGQWMPCCPVS